MGQFKISVWRYREDLKKDIKRLYVKELKKNNFFLILYKVFFFFFKYLILKDFSYVNYKYFLKKYKLNIYISLRNNKINDNFLRYYFLFYYFLFKFKYFKFFSFFIKDFINNNYSFFFNNNYMFFLLYLMYFSFNFLFLYNKFYFYKKIHSKKVFLYHEFFLRVESQYFFSYRKYVEYFRKFKYNEYLSNNKFLLSYPNIKKLLYQKHYSLRALNLRFHKHGLFLFFKIYKLKYESACVNDDDCYYFDRNFFKSFNIVSFFFSSNIFKFINLVSNNFYFFLKNFFRDFLELNLLFLIYNVFFRYKRTLQDRFLKFVNLVGIFDLLYYAYWDFYYYYYQFLQYYNYKYLFKNIYILNYSFLYYYFLKNNNYLFNFITKNFLQHRIVSLIIVDYIEDFYFKVYRYLNKIPEKDPVNRGWETWKLKRWNRVQRRKKKYRLRLLYNSSTQLKGALNRTYSPMKPINLFKDNTIYLSIWQILYYYLGFEFVDIFELYNDDKFNLIEIFSKFRDSFEFISWEVIFGNHNIFNNSYLERFTIIKNIKIDILLNKYNHFFFLHIIDYGILLQKYNFRKFLVNRTFLWFFFRDFFFKC